MSTDIEVNLEALPGYRLVKHLGAGGYGEVWSAEAPGGLMKAIKFVFGQHHEKRASHELRALDRVRNVRHPFLLSLERIEVVDGRLLVVTELADGSLKDRFDECRQRGLPGIPRAELIRYLRDAADALDFMITTHALGHLDIKPENLLLLADHVKVADFGLVKDVRQSQASLVGGMTPLYAAPEVFRGLPGSQSDQYSLAIVYQEVLTGTPPFSGGNAAELTLKHLNDEPDLSSLSDGDRYVLSRALAKDPTHRYGSCREFIDALSASGKEQEGHGSESEDIVFASPGPSHTVASSPSVPTDVFDVDEADAGMLDSARMLIDAPLRQAQMIDLPPVPLDARSAQPVPTLVLGIGGAAGRVLTHLRTVIQDQVGGASSLPAVQMLLIDTDARSTAEVTHHNGAGLTQDETMTLPLQRPQHYREQSQQLLRWLSRRWLYNIPRSLRTEGLRPLGRLALTDHARQAGQRIRRGMMQAIDANAVATSSQTLGQTFRGDALQVFVVASISGGTGGGMSLDMGYAVRAIMEKIGLAKTNVTGIMLHSTGGDARHCELARVNAFSWLTEFQHFQRPDTSYPGDASCGFPAHANGVTAFDDTYLAHLGDNLDAADFDSATRSIAEYLRLNILTPAKAFFEAHRKDTAKMGTATDSDSQRRQHAANVGDSEPHPERTDALLRSFGVFRRTAAAAESCDRFAHLVSQRVLTQWQQGREQDSAKPNSVSAAEMQLVQRLKLDADGIFVNMRALVELHLGADAKSFLSSWLAQRSAEQKSRDGSVLPWVDRIFSDNGGDGSQDHGWLLGQPATAIVEPLAKKLRAELRRWFVSRLDDPQQRLAGARRSLSTLESHLNGVDAKLQKLEHSLAIKVGRLSRGQEAASESGDTDADVPPAMKPLDYMQKRLDHLAAYVAGHTARLLLSDAKVCGEELISLGREFNQMAKNNAAQAAETNNADGSDPLAAWLTPRLDALAEEVDGRLANECLREQGLWTTVMQGGRRRAQLCARLNELSRQGVLRALGDVNVLDEFATSAANATTEMQSHLASATPALLAQGGARRILAIMPHDGNANSAAELSTRLNLNLNTMVGGDNNMTLCVEASGLTVCDVAVELVQRRRDRVDFAGRVQSRTDIQWTPLLVKTLDVPMSTWVDLANTPDMAEPYSAQTMVLE